MSAITDKEVDDIITRYKGLTSRSEVLQQNKLKLEAELSARRRSLKAVMDEARAKGFDPEKIGEELQRAREVVVLKMNVFEAELSEAENMIRPMLKELRETA